MFFARDQRFHVGVALGLEIVATDDIDRNRRIGPGIARQELLKQYDLEQRYYDEMFSAPGQARPHYKALIDALGALPAQEIDNLQQRVNRSLLHEGITFTVYGDDKSIERVFPVDCVPRLLLASEWEHIERGLSQRVQALNLFRGDVYGKGRLWPLPNWPLLLRACNAFEAYGHKFGGALDRGNIVDLLVAEADLPYSLRYVLRRLRACLAVVDPAPDEDLPAQPFVVLKQLDDLLGSRPAASSTSQSRELHELAQLGRLHREFHDALEQSYVYYPADA